MRQTPDSVGRYQILERLSSAAYDDVFKAFDPMIERHLVVKTFWLDGVPDAAARAITDVFFREMQRIGLLAHPGITTLFDAGDLPGGLFFASEFVEGVSLADHFETGLPLSPTERVSLVVQLADALEYAREQGVPHLHLKPSNIIIGPDFAPKIRGFGVAGVEDALEAAGRAPDADERRARAEWLPAERLAGERGDARSDVYALGCIARRILADDAAPAAEVFARALARDPADRFETVNAFKYAMLLALGVDEVHVRTAWDSTREASTVQAAEASTLGELTHTAVNGDLSAMDDVTKLTPSAAEEMATRLAEPAEIAGDAVTKTQPALPGDDARKPS